MEEMEMEVEERLHVAKSQPVKDLKSHIRAYREKHKLSREAFAKQIGKSASTVYNYETGLHKPPKEIVEIMEKNAPQRKVSKAFLFSDGVRKEGKIAKPAIRSESLLRVIEAAIVVNRKDEIVHWEPLHGKRKVR